MFNSYIYTKHNSMIRRFFSLVVVLIVTINVSFAGLTLNKGDVLVYRLVTHLKESELKITILDLDDRIKFSYMVNSQPSVNGTIMITANALGHAKYFEHPFSGGEKTYTGETSTMFLSFQIMKQLKAKGKVNFAIDEEIDGQWSDGVDDFGYTSNGQDVSTKVHYLGFDSYQGERYYELVVLDNIHYPLIVSFTGVTLAFRLMEIL